MKIKNSTFVLLLICYSSLVFSQLSNNSKAISDKVAIHNTISDNNYVTVNLKYIRVYRISDLELIHEIELNSLPENWVPIDLIFFNEKVLFFFKTQNEGFGIRNYILQYQEIDIVNGKLVNDPILVSGVHQEFSLGYKYELKKAIYYPKRFYPIIYVDFPNIKISFSKDSSKLLISNSKDHVFIYNSKMELIQSHDVSNFTNKNNTTVITEYVGNNGRYHAIAKIYHFEDEFLYRKQTSAEYSKYDLVYLSSENSEIRIKDIDELKKHIITGAKLFEISSGQVVCVGVYGLEETAAELAHGYFSFYTDKVDNLKKYPFPLEVIHQYKNVIPKNTRRIRTLVNSIDIKEAEGSGHLIIIGENKSFMKDFNGNISALKYNDFFVLKISLELEKKWLKRLPRSIVFSGKNYGGGSYKYDSYKDSYYLFFLDNKSNTSQDFKKRGKVCNSSINAALSAYSIKENGSVNKVNLYDNFKLPQGFQIHTVMPISNNKILIGNQVGNKKSLIIKLSF